MGGGGGRRGGGEGERAEAFAVLLDAADQRMYVERGRRKLEPTRKTSGGREKLAGSYGC